MMPADGPPTVLAVLSAFSKSVKGKQIDLSKTYTTAFVTQRKGAGAWRVKSHGSHARCRAGLPYGEFP